MECKGGFEIILKTIVRSSQIISTSKTKSTNAFKMRNHLLLFVNHKVEAQTTLWSGNEQIS